MLQYSTHYTIAKRRLNYLKKKQDNPDKYPSYRTGIADLDRATGGLQPGWYVVLAGKQKSGKTAVLNTFRVNFLNAGLSVLDVSLEMGEMQSADRFLSNLTWIPLEKFRDAKLEPEDWKKLEQEIDTTVSGWKGYFAYGANNVSAIKKLVNKLKPQVVIIDYAQLMSDPSMNGKSNDTQMLKKISRELKQITVSDNKKKLSSIAGVDIVEDDSEDYEMDELSPLIIVAAQINREAQKGGDYDLRGIRDTNAFAEDGDLVLILNSMTDDQGVEIPNMRKLKIDAFRHGEPTEFPIMFNGQLAKVGSYKDPRHIDLVEKIE